MIMSFEQYCGHLHEVIPLVIRAALPDFSAKTLYVEAGMLESLLVDLT